MIHKELTREILFDRHSYKFVFDGVELETQLLTANVVLVAFLPPVEHGWFWSTPTVIFHDKNVYQPGMCDGDFYGDVPIIMGRSELRYSYNWSNQKSRQVIKDMMGRVHKFVELLKLDTSKQQYAWRELSPFYKMQHKHDEPVPDDYKGFEFEEKRDENNSTEPAMVLRLPVEPTQLNAFWDEVISRFNRRLHSNRFRLRIYDVAESLDRDEETILHNLLVDYVQLIRNYQARWRYQPQFFPSKESKHLCYNSETGHYFFAPPLEGGHHKYACYTLNQYETTLDDLKECARYIYRRTLSAYQCNTNKSSWIWMARKDILVKFEKAGLLAILGSSSDPVDVCLNARSSR